MWISGVDFPEELVAAARRHELVIFVGAGASRDSPADLPDFRQLTKDVLAEAALSALWDESASPDLLLGKAKDEGADVHRRVAARIAAPSSAPNALHEAIVALGAASGVPRIVTTNYDGHLSTVAGRRHAAWQEYMAPALPMGDDFAGIVYLHGSLTQDPMRLVLTDSDFGRAYMRDAWASRFLERMFGTYTVLFVGYSHGDVPMRYLARSLGPRTSRFVLTSDPGDRGWRTLGLTPIGYERAGSSHRALPAAVGGLAQLLSMGLLEHRQRLAQIVAAPPSGVPEEASYIASVLDDEATAAVFTGLAGGDEWLRWVAALPRARPLFSPAAEHATCSWVLARWFADQWLADEDRSRCGLELVSGAGGTLAPSLWEALGGALHGSPKPRPRWLNAWIALLVENAPDTGRDWLEYALVSSVLPADREACLLLFDHLTEPRLVSRPSLGLGAAPPFDIDLRGDDYWLRDAWAKVLQPSLGMVAPDVLGIADRHLRRARWLLVAAGGANVTWDPVAFGRSSIATHDQDRYGDKIGILIDAARDSIEQLSTIEPGAATAFIDSWAHSDVPILRRLAIHAVATDGHREADEKVGWLLHNNLLFGPHLKHEVFELLAEALPAASEPVTGDVIAAVRRRAAGDAEITDAYEAFNALVWIDRHSASPAARQALDDAKTEHPEFGTRDHPDHDTWTEGGFRGFAAPMPAEQLHTMLEQDPTAAMEKLTALKSSRFPFDAPTWEDAIELVRRVVAANPEDGFSVLTAARDDELVRAAIEGWGATALTRETARGVVRRLGELDLGRFGDDIARLLAASPAATRGTDWPSTDGARPLARAVLRSLPDVGQPDQASSWLQHAINDAGGHLAQFWLHAVARDWSSDEAGWVGLDAETRDALKELLERDDRHGALGRVVLASQLHFFAAADREWGLANILPMLRWSDRAQAEQAWDGFLLWGRWTNQLLQDGLLSAYLETVHEGSALGGEAWRRLAEHLAAVSLYSEVHPSTWTAEFTRAASPSLRVEWIDQVSWMLGKMDDDVAQRQWARWMRRYWTDRLDSVPVRLTLEESSAIAAWAAHSAAVIEDAVGLALRSPSALEAHGGVLFQIRERAGEAPAAYAQLLAHLLAGTQRPFWGCDMVHEILGKTRAHASEQVIRQIREESLRLGCHNAADW
ncbi:MAG: DUF4020 domain-containing protein [Chloroflexota bacterium]